MQATASPMIHIVDDDEAVRLALAFLLTSVGYTVQVHESGQRFLDQFDGTQGAILITDLIMPDTDGLSLLQKIDGSCPVAAILISGDGDALNDRTAVESGAIGFLRKPFSERELLAAVRTAEAHLSC